MRHLERPISRRARHVFVGAIIASVLLVVTGTRAIDENLPSSLSDSELRDELLFRADALPRLRSLLVSVDGQLVEEHYYHGATASRLANVKSVSKSIISLLVGIAIDRGHIVDVDQSVGDYFPEYFKPGANLEHTEITVENLLSMQAGLETTSNRNYGRWVQSANWTHHILTRPIVARPGGRRIYSTGNTHLLSAILGKVSGVNTLEFARRRLAAPLGFTLPAWYQDPQGIYFGGNEMQMTPRSMVAIGQLVLSCGMHNGIQIVSEEWVHRSLEPRSRSERSGREYGYGWWIRRLAGYQTYYAWGYGGQFIFVVPKLNLVVVTTSSPNPGDGRRTHLASLYSLVENQIIPAVHQRNQNSARRLVFGE